VAGSRLIQGRALLSFPIGIAESLSLGDERFRWSTGIVVGIKAELCAGASNRVGARVGAISQPHSTQIASVAAATVNAVNGKQNRSDMSMRAELSRFGKT